MNTPKPVSDQFEDAFSSGLAGCVRTCACGIITFDGFQNYDWEDGELENLKAQAAQSPDKYRDVDYSVQTMVIDGNEFVMGCPCNRARKYEDFVIRHGRQIAQYLSARAKMLRDQASQLEISR